MAPVEQICFRVELAKVELANVELAKVDGIKMAKVELAKVECSLQTPLKLPKRERKNENGRERENRGKFWAVQRRGGPAEGRRRGEEGTTHNNTYQHQPQHNTTTHKTGLAKIGLAQIGQTTNH